MEEMVQNEPGSFTPFVIREMTETELKRQLSDSPTHSILKTPTAVFPKAEDLYKSGKRLTFAESPEYNDSPTRTLKSAIKNGGNMATPSIEVAVSPTKSIQVSPESWKAYLAYQRCYEDYSNETVKTDYTYSPLSPFYNREIIPGIPMRPNMSRRPLHDCHSAPASFITTPISSKIKISKKVVSDSLLVSSINERLMRWKRDRFFIRRRKFSLEDETGTNLWWWILLLLFILGAKLLNVGTIAKLFRTFNIDHRRPYELFYYNISEISSTTVEYSSSTLCFDDWEFNSTESNTSSPIPDSYDIVGLWISRSTFDKFESSIADSQYMQLWERVRILELAVTEEMNKHKNFSISLLFEAMQISRAQFSTSYRRCCRSLRTLMLSNLNRMETELTDQDNYLRLFRNQLEKRLLELSTTWSSEIEEMKKTVIEFDRESFKPSIKTIIADIIKRYDSDKTGRADFALESSGGRVASIRCTQPWPGSKSHISFDPSIVIRKNVAPGNCWAFQGEGNLLLELSHAIYVSGISIEHIPHTIHPHGHTASAPKNFTLLGLQDENADSSHLFGQYMYSIEPNSNTIQYFEVTRPNSNLFKFVEVVISSNHGNPYTCLYRVRIHGVLP